MIASDGSENRFNKVEDESCVLVLRATRPNLDQILSRLYPDRRISETRVRPEYNSLSFDVDDDLIQIIHVTEARQDYITVLQRKDDIQAFSFDERLSQALDTNSIYLFRYQIDDNGQIHELDPCGNPVQIVSLDSMVERGISNDQRILQLSVSPYGNSELFTTAQAYKKKMSLEGVDIKIVAVVAGLASQELEYVKSIEARLSREEYSSRMSKITESLNAQKEIFDSADIIVVTNAIDKYLVCQERNGIYASKVSEIKASFDLSHGPTEISETTKSGFAPNKIFTFTGELSVYGGLDTVLEAYYLVKREKPNITLILGGHYDEKAVAESFHALERKGLVEPGTSKMSEHKLTIKIREADIYTHREDSWDEIEMISAGDYTIVPRSASFFQGNAILSMRLGIPVICHDTEQIQESTSCQPDQISLNYGSKRVPESESLRRMMLQCLKDESMTARVAANARGYLELNWNTNEQEAAAYQSLYDNLVPALNAHTLEIKVRRQKPK